MPSRITGLLEISATVASWQSKGSSTPRITDIIDIFYIMNHTEIMLLRFALARISVFLFALFLARFCWVLFRYIERVKLCQQTEADWDRAPKEKIWCSLTYYFIWFLGMFLSAAWFIYNVIRLDVSHGNLPQLWTGFIVVMGFVRLLARRAFISGRELETLWWNGSSPIKAFFRRVFRIENPQDSQDGPNK